jgi:3-oxoacyl-[acyl-carrier protein] reductase/meso-butanediol dehydrogenase/(S,S)-butanediol dehydrogenase/diacetyl reductase
MSRTVIITGGSKGIGWGLVQTFASNGYKVVSGSRSFINEVPKQIAANIKQIEIDVKNKGDHIKLVKTALEWTGKLDCYINNAGYSEWRDLRSIDEQFLTDIFQTNLFGYFWGAQAAMTAMTVGVSILNISSLAAKRGTSNNSAYSATKFGVTGLTQSLCKELGPKGIRVNAVCPVLVETPGLIAALNSDKSPAGLDLSKFLNDFAKNQSALGRLPTINEVAELCLFLSSEKASGITGQSINIDCGVLPN